MLFSPTVGSIPYVGGYIGFSDILPPNPIRLPMLPAIVFSSINKVPFFYLILFLFLIIIMIIKAFFSSRIGRNWEAIGLDPQLAATIGINVFRYKVFAFVVASAIAGLTGSFYAHYEGYISPDSFGMWTNIYLQVYAFLGGIGYIILGPLIGSAIMSIMPELLRGASVLSPIINGFILILLVLFLPTGLLGLWKWRTPVKESLFQVDTIIKSLFPR
jgi:branched-chain amino acid transport system permease protein